MYIYIYRHTYINTHIVFLICDQTGEKESKVTKFQIVFFVYWFYCVTCLWHNLTNSIVQYSTTYTVL